METPGYTRSTTPSFARQAAGISLIRDNICRFVDTNEEPGLESDKTAETIACATLASLLRTSHEFFFSAARLLWGGREIGTKDLLTILPGVVKKRWNNSSTVCALITTTTSDPEFCAGILRFGLYAPYVRHLKSGLVIYLHKDQDMSAIRAYAQTQTLLPNLISLSTRGPTYATRDESANTLLDWLEILSSPSLQKLDLSHSQTRDSFLRIVVDRFYRLIENITMNCPELRTLSFCYGGPPAMHYPTFLSAHTKVPDKVETLKCRYFVFCPETLAWLAHMHELRQLELEQLDGFDRAFDGTPLSKQSPNFPALKHLILTDTWVGPTKQLFNSSLITNLVRLDIQNTTEHGWFSDFILRLCLQLVESCPKLTELSLDCAPSQLSSSALISLKPLALRKLSVPRATRKMIGGPRAIRNLLALWPSLECLDLRAYEASFEDLAHIIPFGPQLSTLRLSIEMSIPYGISNTNITPSTPQSADVRQPLLLVSSQEHPRRTYEISELEELAKYLSSLQPHISFWTCVDREAPWLFRPYTWLKYLNAELDKNFKADLERREKIRIS